MAQNSELAPVHCYTNPSFCRQSEYIPDDQPNDLPPPPQFQSTEDLPPPPPPSQLQLQLQLQCNGGQSNPAFQETGTEARVNGYETKDRYCYLDENPPATGHQRYASLPTEEHRIAYNQSSRYEYIQDDQRSQLQRRGSSRYDYVPAQHRPLQPQTQPQTQLQLQLQNQRQRHQQQVQQRSTPVASQQFQMQAPAGSRSQAGRYAVIPGEPEYTEQDSVNWNQPKRVSPVRRHVNTPQGRYARVPLHDDEGEVEDVGEEDPPPALPDRGGQELSVSPRNNLATQKLHEILTTPRKPRSRSEERTLSPRRHQSFSQPAGTPQRRARTPVGSPSGRTLSPGRSTPHGTPQNRAFYAGPAQTSTPNKEPSARRCLPLLENSRQQDVVCPASNCGKLRYVGTAPVDLTALADPPPRYGYIDNGPESMPMVSGSPRYRVVPADGSQKRTGYQSVESAFIARTAVVPPLSPPNSDVNTTLASGFEKTERRNAPLLLVLVGILTCGLALYLSWSQERRYYYDSAAGCGACCALAGACRSLRRTWTGLGLAGLAALSCAGLLLLAAKAPKPGTPLHDVTAGALCGVSLLGAALALLALLTPRCNFGRHRRVHSWIPRLSPYSP